MNKIKILVVDDSALVRKYVSEIINEDPMLEVSATASDPYIAVKKIAEVRPDVITLDMEMPRMDGLTFLQRLMSQHPIPVIVLSSLTSKGSETAIKALEYGAVEVIQKPELKVGEFLINYKDKLRFKIKAAAKATLTRKRKVENTPKSPSQNLSTDKRKLLTHTTDKVIAIGASTGGTEAIKAILMQCTIRTSGIVIVQHMPEMFTRQFAERLNNLSQMDVKEAESGDRVYTGKVLIAPGNKHMVLKRSGARYYVDIIDGEPVNRHRPSVDVLFDSAARIAGKNCLGVLLTGMGNDGAQGLLNMKKAGADTIAQDKESSIVFGMPNEAIKLGAHQKVYSLQKISQVVSHV